MVPASGYLPMTLKSTHLAFGFACVGSRMSPRRYVDAYRFARMLNNSGLGLLRNPMMLDRFLSLPGEQWRRLIWCLDERYNWPDGMLHILCEIRRTTK